MKKSKSNKKEDIKELVKQERLNSHLSKRKKELSKKLNIIIFKYLKIFLFIYI